jgi:hypothetical protein
LSKRQCLVEPSGLQEPVHLTRGGGAGSVHAVFCQ